MSHYDLCLAWNWKHDADFVTMVEQSCRSHGLSMLEVTPSNWEEKLRALVKKQIACRAFLDRASDEDERFIPFDQWARDHSVFRINPREQAVRAWNKAIMHLALMGAGLHTPYTIVLPSYEEKADLDPIDLSPLGKHFVIKPAHGGSGEGVITGASSLAQVILARQQYPADQYLLQAHVAPTQLGSWPAWFRVIYCGGQVYPCWWNPKTRIYIPVSAAEEHDHGLTPLRHMAATIAGVCRLELFSTEIALSPEGLWVVVDYVNDQIDLRLQSRAGDGVPDEIVRGIAEGLITLIKTHRTSQ